MARSMVTVIALLAYLAYMVAVLTMVPSAVQSGLADASDKVAAALMVAAIFACMLPGMVATVIVIEVLWKPGGKHRA